MSARYNIFVVVILPMLMISAGGVYSAYVLEPKSYSVILEPGQSLELNSRTRSHEKYSPNSGYRFALESGRLVVYDQCSGNPTFSTFSDGSTVVSELSLSATTGQLMMKGSHGVRRDTVLWSSGNSPAITDYSDAELRLTDNGFLELCAKAKPRCYWQSSGVRVRTCESEYGNATQLVLLAGDSMKVGTVVHSPNGEYKTQLQPDGNFLVLRSCDETPVFSSYSYPGTAGNVTLDRNGSLIVYGSVYSNSDRALWFAEPWKLDGKYANSQLILDDNGLMYLCQKGGDCYWQSGFLLYYDHCDQVQSEHSGSHLGEVVSTPQTLPKANSGLRISSGFVLELGLLIVSGLLSGKR